MAETQKHAERRKPDTWMSCALTCVRGTGFQSWAGRNGDLPFDGYRVSMGGDVT